MKEHGLICCEAMIQAFLAGRKTQTRRIPKDQTAKSYLYVEKCELYPSTLGVTYTGWAKDCGQPFLLPTELPYQVGDRLYVKETWATCRLIRDHTDEAVSVSVPPVRAQVETRETHLAYRADGDDAFEGPWRSGRFMPKWAARLWYEVVEVKEPHQVQDISEEDAVAEGIYGYQAHGGGTHYNPVTIYAAFPEKGGGFRTAIEAFECLWDSLHGRGAWERNDWVFPYVLKRIEP